MWGDVFEDFLDDIGWSVDDVLRTDDRRLGLRLRGSASHARHRNRHGLRRAKRQAAGTPDPRADRDDDRTLAGYEVASTARGASCGFDIDISSATRRPAFRGCRGWRTTSLPYLATPRRALKRMLVRGAMRRPHEPVVRRRALRYRRPRRQTSWDPGLRHRTRRGTASEQAGTVSPAPLSRSVCRGDHRFPRRSASASCRRTASKRRRSPAS